MAAPAIFLFLLLTIRSSLAMAQSQRQNLTQGSSLSPVQLNPFLLSSSGLFAFGFYQEGDGFAVGIWYAKIQPMIVIWNARRDESPHPKDVTLNLTIDGKLLLNQNLMIPSTFTSEIAAASILDSGNFVLYNLDSKVIWQSFDFPTDTLLPGQVLLTGNKLVSSISVKNHSTGKFQIVMQGDGNLVQYSLPAFRPLTTTDYYWSSQTNGAGVNVTLNFSESSQLYLSNATSIMIKSLYDGGGLTGSFLLRATLDADGIFRVYSFDQNRNGNWTMQWSSINNKCDPIGLCNPNQYCALNDQETVCNCLPGFVRIDYDQGNRGCWRDFETRVCSYDSRNVDYRELQNVLWSDQPYSVVFNVSLDACKDECSRDYNCEAAVYDEYQKCSKQKLPLLYGNYKLIQATTLIKACRETVKREGKNDQKVKIIILGVAIPTSIILILTVTAIGIIAYKFRLMRYQRIVNQEKDGMMSDLGLRSFKYSDLETATNGFGEELGRGAFGSVYKGFISDGKIIAVKRLDAVVDESEREFQNEMRVIGRTHHRNLVQLLGFCHEGTNRLLVYEYMSNGSLADFLFKSETKLAWEERIRLTLDIARGILYLHEECETQIIHCDIKPENILMDEKHCAKIADFGLAKLLGSYQTKTRTRVRGTRGYVAPEWHKNMPITTKADVYSFGVMLLEIICYRRSLKDDAPEDEVVLVEWVYDCFEGNKMEKLMEEEEEEEEEDEDEGEIDKRKLERAVKIGLWCIQNEPSLRPTMKKVVLMLEGTVDIPTPPCPTSFLSSI